jgi:hypothetical protein
MDKRIGNRLGSSRGTGPFHAETYSVDLEALRSTTRRGLPTLAVTTSSLLRSLENRKERSAWMGFPRRLKEHPRAATLFAGCIVGVILLLVPISYDKTVGHEVSLQMPSSTLGEQAIGKIAGDLGDALRSDEVRISLGVANQGGAAGPSITARVVGASREDLERETAAVAARLAGKGINATFAVSPIIERVRGNVYLAAASSIVRIRAHEEYASADEMVDDIRSQLEAAGVTDSEVSVDMSGGRTRICVRALSETPAGVLPEIQCETEPGVDEGCLKLQVRRTPGMSDADVIAEIERQLAEQGHSGEVTLDENGCPRIELEE